MPPVAREEADLLEEGDITLSQGLARGTYRILGMGLCVGHAFLRERATSPPMRHAIYTVGSFSLQGVTVFVGVIQGRCDLFIGHWWTHSRGPMLMRLENLRLDDAAPFPLDAGPPGQWKKLGQDFKGYLQRIVEEVCEAMAPAKILLGAEEQNMITARYRGTVTFLVGKFRTWAAGRGHILDDQDIASACHPDWTASDLLRARPGFLHALAVVIATQRAIGVHALSETPPEWEASVALVAMGQSRDTGIPCSTDAAASLITTATRVLQGLPEYSVNGCLTDWAALRKRDPQVGILPTLWHLNDASWRSQLDENRTVLRGAPRKDGLVKRGGSVDDRKRWSEMAKEAVIENIRPTAT